MDESLNFPQHVPMSKHIKYRKIKKTVGKVKATKIMGKYLTQAWMHSTIGCDMGNTMTILHIYS
jgi:hypothetical protein